MNRLYIQYFIHMPVYWEQSRECEERSDAWDWTSHSRNLERWFRIQITSPIISMVYDFEALQVLKHTYSECCDAKVRWCERDTKVGAYMI